MSGALVGALFSLPYRELYVVFPYQLSMKMNLNTAGTTSHNVNLNLNTAVVPEDPTLWEEVRKGLLLPTLSASMVLVAWAAARRLETVLDQLLELRTRDAAWSPAVTRMHCAAGDLAAALGLEMREDPFLPGDDLILYHPSSPDGIGLRVEGSGFWNVDDISVMLTSDLDDRLHWVEDGADRLGFALRCARWSPKMRDTTLWALWQLRQERRVPVKGRFYPIWWDLWTQASPPARCAPRRRGAL